MCRNPLFCTKKPRQTAFDGAIVVNDFLAVQIQIKT